MPGERPVRVGINLLWLVPGVVGGTEDAAVGTLRALAGRGDVELVVYAQRRFADAHPELAATLTTRTVAIPGRSPIARVVAESTWLPWVARRDRLDVLHCYGGVVPPLAPRPSVLTLHDVQPLEHPASFRALKARWLAAMIPRSIATAELTAVPSRFVADRVAARLDVDPARLRVIHHGVRTATVDSDRALDPTTVRARFGLKRPVVLYPAITYPHKNHVTLVEAWARLRDRGVDADLVLTGGTGPAEAEVRARIAQDGLGDHVHRLGRVSDVELDGLYRTAAVVAFPSTYEGFGLPVLEAMHVGCPVVAANAAALPEVVADAGVLVDPHDPGAWADAIAELLADEARRTALGALGLERARAHEWRNLAPLVVDMYRTAARAHPHRGNPR